MPKPSEKSGGGTAKNALVGCSYNDNACRWSYIVLNDSTLSTEDSSDAIYNVVMGTSFPIIFAYTGETISDKVLESITSHLKELASDYTVYLVVNRDLKSKFTDLSNNKVTIFTFRYDSV